MIVIGIIIAGVIVINVKDFKPESVSYIETRNKINI